MIRPAVKNCILISALVFLGLAAPAWGQVINEDSKLLPDDGMSGAFFGNAVAIDGNIAVIGALSDSSNGIASGSVYLFDIQTGNQLFKLLPDDPTEGSEFGYSVAIDNGIVVIGARKAWNSGFRDGAAYLFNAATGEQIAKLGSFNPNSNEVQFGTSVAISGSLVVVGAPFDDQSGSNSGAAYLFNSQTGAYIRKIRAPGILPNMRLGHSVATNGSIIIAGTPNDVNSSPFAGSAFLFNAITGSATARFFPEDGFGHDNFGHTVALRDDTVVIGMWHPDFQSGPSFGRVYVFDIATQNQLGRLTPDSLSQGDYFGSALAVDGDVAIIGSYADDSNAGLAGSAYFFDLTTNTQMAKLSPTDFDSGDKFGRAVAISGNKAVVGAWTDDDNGPGSGSVYIFTVPPPPCPADFTSDNILDFFDVSAFLQAFASNDPIADFTDDGIWDFFDISAFLQAFAAGCP